MSEWVLGAGGVAAAATIGAELVHARRVRRLARLAFGPGARPAAWVRGVPIARALCAGLLAFGLALLLTVEAKVHRQEGASEDEFRHLVLVLDVSPSMRLQDAGPTGQQSRTHRARDVLDSLFGRVAIGRYKITVVATYNGALPVVEDTLDTEVVRNVMTDLPMHYAFRPGKTRLFDGIEKAAELASKWEPGSTTLMIMSDGDTVPATGMPKLPRSVSGVLVIGVGDPVVGRFIDGRQSRQDASSLRQIAVRLGGVYQDGNARHVSSDVIRQVTEAGESSPLEQLSEREYALMASAVGGLGLAVLPLLLHLFGTSWRPGKRRDRGGVGQKEPAPRRGGGMSGGRTSDRVRVTMAGPPAGRAGTLSEESVR